MGGSFANDGWECKTRLRTQGIRDADEGYEETPSDSKLYKGSRYVPRIREQEDDVSVCDYLLQYWLRQSVVYRIDFDDEGLAEADDGFYWSGNHCFSGF